MERWRFLPFEPSRIPTSSSTPASVRTGEPAGSWIRVSEHLISTQFRWLESTYKPTNPPLPRKELSITEHRVLFESPARITYPRITSTRVLNGRANQFRAIVDNARFKGKGKGK